MVASVKIVVDSAISHLSERIIPHFASLLLVKALDTMRKCAYAKTQEMATVRSARAVAIFRFRPYPPGLPSPCLPSTVTTPIPQRRRAPVTARSDKPPTTARPFERPAGPRRRNKATTLLGQQLAELLPDARAR